MKEDIEIHWVCLKCGEEYCNHGLLYPATWHNGICDMCGKEESVTEIRDFGYLKKGVANRLKYIFGEKQSVEPISRENVSDGTEDKASEDWKERESIWDRLAPLSAMQELVGNNTPFEKIIDGVGREILLDFIESEKQKSELELIDRIRKEWIKVREKMDIPYGEDDEKNFYEGYCEGYNQGITDIAKEVCKFEDLISNERKDK